MSRTTARTRRCSHPALTPRPDGGLTLTFSATPGDVGGARPVERGDLAPRNHEVAVSSEAIGKR